MRAEGFGRIACAGLAAAGFASSVAFVAQPVSSSPLVIAHRGASAEFPENTPAAFRRALALRVDGIELDVQTTRDGVAVVFHDHALKRLTGERGRLSTKTWAELKPLRVHGREKIPALAETLRLVRGGAVVHIELKRGVAVAPVVAAVRAAGAEAWVILGSFEAPLLAEAAALAPDLKRMLITEGQGGPAKLLRQLARVGGVGLSVNHRVVRRADFVRRVHAAGATLWCWTVNDPGRMRELAAFGVDAILSDDPALLRKTLS